MSTTSKRLVNSSIMYEVARDIGRRNSRCADVAMAEVSSFGASIDHCTVATCLNRRAKPYVRRDLAPPWPRLIAPADARAVRATDQQAAGVCHAARPLASTETRRHPWRETRARSEPVHALAAARTDMAFKHRHIAFPMSSPRHLGGDVATIGDTIPSEYIHTGLIIRYSNGEHRPMPSRRIFHGEKSIN